MSKATPAEVQRLTDVLNSIVERRDSLTKERDEAIGSLDDEQLSAQIVEINSKTLPDLRKQVEDMRNSAKGALKHQFAEIIEAIEMALNGIGTFVDADVSETRLKALEEEQRNCKTSRQAKAIESQIAQIRWANKQQGKQQKLLANEEETRRRNEEEIARLDSVLYGHLEGSGAESQVDA